MIRIGSAGTDGLGYDKAFEILLENGLSALEVEFTYGVRMSNEKARGIGELAREKGIRLSVHGPYYINLSSLEQEKIEASKKRIIDSCERAHHLGASPVVFHAGFYQKRDQEEVYELIKTQIKELMQIISEKGWNVKLAPETTGKKTQFGSLQELLRLSEETGCSICVDFAHLLAREGHVDYDDVLRKLKAPIHSHFSGIEYTEKGEKRHLLLEEKDIKALFQKLIDYKMDITVINESPEPIDDAIKMGKVLKRLVK